MSFDLEEWLKIVLENLAAERLDGFALGPKIQGLLRQAYNLGGAGATTAAPPAVERREQVNHPRHYNDHPSGVECIDLVEWLDFNTGNALKYLWRAGLKEDQALQDLKKARFYFQRALSHGTHLTRPGPGDIFALVRRVCAAQPDALLSRCLRVLFLDWVADELSLASCVAKVDAEITSLEGAAS